MNQVNTFGDISPNTAGGLEAMMLKVAAPQTVTARFAQIDPLPKNKGKTRTFRRYHALPAATAPLAEGVTPTGQRISYDDVEATLEQFGDLVWITDVVQDTHTDPVLKVMATRCGDQIADTVEAINISVIKGGTNVVYAAQVAGRTSVVTAPSRGDLRLCVRTLRKQRAAFISEIVGGSAKVGTEPVGEAYFAMCHTDLESDLRAISGFVPVENYSDAMKALKYEIGKIENIRFIATPNFTPWVSGGAASTLFLAGGVKPGSSLACDVYPIIIVGRDAYGTVPLQGEGTVKPMVKQPEPNSSDPLAQRGFVSWKLYHTSVILNQLWMIRLEAACTASPA